MSEESPIYGATNDDIIRLGNRLTGIESQLILIRDTLRVLNHVNHMPMLLDLSTRLEALEDREQPSWRTFEALKTRVTALEDKLGDTGDGHSPDRSARVGSVSRLGQTISKASPSKRDDQPRHTLD